jgi:hypothetical protein
MAVWPSTLGNAVLLLVVLIPQLHKKYRLHSDLRCAGKHNEFSSTGRPVSCLVRTTAGTYEAPSMILA